MTTFKGAVQKVINSKRPRGAKFKLRTWLWSHRRIYKDNLRLLRFARLIGLFPAEIQIQQFTFTSRPNSKVGWARLRPTENHWRLRFFKWSHFVGQLYTAFILVRFVQMTYFGDYVSNPSRTTEFLLHTVFLVVYFLSSCIRRLMWTFNSERCWVYNQVIEFGTSKAIECDVT